MLAAPPATMSDREKYSDNGDGIDAMSPYDEKKDYLAADVSGAAPCPS